VDVAVVVESEKRVSPLPAFPPGLEDDVNFGATFVSWNFPPSLPGSESLSTQSLLTSSTHVPDCPLTRLAFSSELVSSPPET
jgi:hypothetical protein